MNAVRLARITITIARQFISGTVLVVMTLGFAIVVGFYAKMLWRALLFGWELIL